MNKINIISIVVAGFCALYSYNTFNRNEQLKTLIHINDSEHKLLQSQLLDLSSQIPVIRSNEYHKGFEQGRVQLGIAFMNEENMLNYSDGYHTAISQFSHLINSNKNLLKNVTSTKKE